MLQAVLSLGARRLSEASPVAAHLSPGDIILSVNLCPVKGSRDWLTCLTNVPVLLSHEAEQRSTGSKSLVSAKDLVDQLARHEPYRGMFRNMIPPTYQLIPLVEVLIVFHASTLSGVTNQQVSVLQALDTAYQKSSRGVRQSAWPARRWTYVLIMSSALWSVPIPTILSHCEVILIVDGFLCPSYFGSGALFRE